MHRDLWKLTKEGAIELCVHAHAGAGPTDVAGRHGSALKVRVAAPPETKQANDALQRALAEAFGTKTNEVQLVSGATSRTKLFTLTGIDPDQFMDRIKELISAGTTGPGPGKRGRNGGWNRR